MSQDEKPLAPGATPPPPNLAQHGDLAVGEDDGAREDLRNFGIAAGSKEVLEFAEQTYDAYTEATLFNLDSPDAYKHVDKLLRSYAFMPLRSTYRRIFDPEDLAARQETQRTLLRRKSSGDLSRRERARIRYNELQTRVSRWFERRRARRGYWFPMWRKTLRKTEALYGSSVVSYFVFTRWLTILNLGIGLIWFFLVVLPWLQYTDPRTVRWPPFIINEDREFDTSFSFLSGELMDDTFFFYSGYQEQYESWDLDFWYSISITAMFVISFFAIVLSIGESIRRTGSTALVRKDKVTPFASMIFGTWDHTTQSARAVSNLQDGIATYAKELLTDTQGHEKAATLSDWGLVKLFSRRALGWTIAIGVVVGVNFAIGALAVESSKPAGERSLELFAPDSQFRVINFFIIPAIISAINLAAPQLFRLLPRLESWHLESTAVKITLGRMFFQKMASLYVLLLAIVDARNSRIESGVDCEAVRSDISLTIQAAPEDSRLSEAELLALNNCCVEAQISQLFYRLVITDTLVIVASTIGIGFLKMWYTKKRSEFDVPANVIELIYRQTLLWIGAVFSPIVPLIAVIGSFFIFYAKYFTLIKTGQPPTTPFGFNKANNVFLTYLGIALAVAAVPTGLFITTIRGVGECGPHQGVSPFGAMEGVVLDGPVWLAWLYDNFRQPPVLLGLLLLVAVRAYFLGTRSSRLSYKLEEAVNALEEERREKARIVAHMASTPTGRSSRSNTFSRATGSSLSQRVGVNPDGTSM